MCLHCILIILIMFMCYEAGVIGWGLAFAGQIHIILKMWVLRFGSRVVRSWSY